MQKRFRNHRERKCGDRLWRRLLSSRKSLPRRPQSLGCHSRFFTGGRKSVSNLRPPPISRNPLSSIFKITNEQGYPLEDLSVEVSLRCVKMGRGDDTSPVDKCLPSMHTSGPRWTKHTLRPHEPYEISPGDKLFVTPGGLLYAQIDIFVSFQPWRIPHHFESAFRFESRRLTDGTFQWLHIPND